MRQTTFLHGLTIALSLGTAAMSHAADKNYGPGVSDTEIKLGQTVAYSGPASAFSSYGRVMTGYFQMLNESGGINGRKIVLSSLDNAFSPPKALEQTRKLVEDIGIFADVGTVGTTPNVAIQKYLNQNKVPHVFISAGGKRFNDPKNFPWSVPLYPAFGMEGRTFGNFIMRTKPGAKIAVLYQNDDFGKDFLTGLKAALGNDATKIVAEATHELTDPTIDSQIIKLKDSGADVLMEFTTPKFVAQAVRKTAELGWRPMQFLVSTSNSVETVLRPAGLDNAKDVYTSQFTKQAADPAWANDPEVIEYVAFIKKWAPNDNPSDFVALSGYITAQAIAYGLQRSGNELTRENLVKQASSFHGQRFKMMLPGVELNNSSQDYAAYRSLRVARFDGTSWVLADKPETSGQASNK
ncbi:ABC transporter substrate-binding protein [Tardiphaga sp.]|jgi:branched-chain amino acid transport system substrate-binding protein|uniref:ABC transporter substrate-binding protein n=1 Tax=Tardiphaga sp. TaxID=1926292 RepID=UPI0037D9982F